MLKPWQVAQTRHERDYSIFRTRTLDVTAPRDGKSYVRTVIDAPDWVNVIALTRSGDVVLVRQFRFGTWSMTLEIPGGMVDPGEDAATAASRELEEETGYRPARLVPLGFSHPNPAIMGNRLFTFAALDCERVSEGDPDDSEDLEVVVLPRAEIIASIKRGEITHALVLAALMLEQVNR